MKKNIYIKPNARVKALRITHIIAASPDKLEIHGGSEPEEGSEAVSTEEQNVRQQIMDVMW